jgi:hypothetical protein
VYSSITSLRAHVLKLSNQTLRNNDTIDACFRVTASLYHSLMARTNYCHVA